MNRNIIASFGDQLVILLIASPKMEAFLNYYPVIGCISKKWELIRFQRLRNSTGLNEAKSFIPPLILMFLPFSMMHDVLLIKCVYSYITRDWLRIKNLLCLTLKLKHMACTF